VAYWLLIHAMDYSAIQSSKGSYSCYRLVACTIEPQFHNDRESGSEEDSENDSDADLPSRSPSVPVLGFVIC